MTRALEPAALEQLFASARTFNEWHAEPISRADVQRLYELLKWGPTSANCCPARFVWVMSDEGKQKLAATAVDVNQVKIRSAPLTVIVGYDLDFPETFPQLFPARGELMKSLFSQPGLKEDTAYRNSTLQGAYLILAARALGLDCGPMSGFDNKAVDAAFFAGSNIRSNFICGIGHGKEGTPYPRNPRLAFDAAGRYA